LSVFELYKSKYMTKIAIIIFLSVEQLSEGYRNMFTVCHMFVHYCI